MREQQVTYRREKEMRMYLKGQWYIIISFHLVNTYESVQSVYKLSQNTRVFRGERAYTPVSSNHEKRFRDERIHTPVAAKGLIQNRESRLYFWLPSAGPKDNVWNSGWHSGACTLLEN